MPAVGWECAFGDYWYGLTVAEGLRTADGEAIRFALTDAPGEMAPSTRWYNISVNLLQASTGFAGDMIFWADTVCCDLPVNTEEKAWGAVKAIYR